MSDPETPLPIPMRLPSGRIIENSWDSRQWAKAFIAEQASDADLISNEEKLKDWFGWPLLIGADRERMLSSGTPMKGTPVSEIEGVST